MRYSDAQANELYSVLMTRASVPYFEMVENWIFRGVIKDPYDEFQVKSRDDLSKDNLRDDFNDTCVQYCAFEVVCSSLTGDGNGMYVVTGTKDTRCVRKSCHSSWSRYLIRF